MKLYNSLTIKITGLAILSMVTFSAQAEDEVFSLDSGTDVLQTSDRSIPSENGNTSASKSSLKEYMQQDSQAVKEEKTAENNKSDKTWINDLVEKVATKGAKVISNKIGDEEENIHRSNASVFDISGVMLRMNVEQSTNSLIKRGYQKTSEKREIPNFIRWRYEEECRNQGVVGYERIGNCVVRMAQKNNYQYIQELVFNNFRTKESVEVFFTSNFTGNKVYRIIYHTDAANIKGSGAKSNYLRNIKIYDFWKKINQKYGVPDNKERVTWGLGANKPFLQAKTGYLVLFDPMLLELDYTRMSREDQKFLNTAVYTF